MASAEAPLTRWIFERMSSLSRLLKALQKIGDSLNSGSLENKILELVMNVPTMNRCQYCLYKKKQFDKTRTTIKAQKGTMLFCVIIFK